MKYSGSAIIILILLLSCKNQQFDNEEPISVPKDTIIPQKITSSPGTMISIGVVKGEDIFTYHGSYRDEQKPNDTTLYEIASITKVFTGLLSAIAVNESKLNIDDPVTKYLPNQDLPKHFEKITIRNLLTHRAGLPLLLPDISDRLVNPEWETLAPYYNSLRENYSTEEFFNDLRTLPLSTTEKSYAYSNIGANLMGYSLSGIYNQSYEDLLRTKIFSPLGMSHTYIQDDRFKPTQGWRDGRNIPIRSESHMNADGGIVSCVADMIRFIQYNIESDLPDVALSQSEISPVDDEGADIGFFWQIDRDQFKTLYHPGGSFGTTSLLIIRPETKSGVFIVTNQAGPHLHPEIRRIAESLLNFQL